jgi:multidrug efflux pump subunit AcrA (membrane-fusion protein)
VQTAPAARATAGRTIRTVGIVVPDETRVRRVQTKVAGWIEKLYVNFTGQYVAAGQPLVSIYSPELLSTQEEYLRAKKTAEQFTSSPDPEVRGIGVDLVRSARRRLELFDIPASFIDSLEKLGTPQKAVTLVAPFAGSVTAKSAFEGQKVEPGMELFTLSDLSKVWVEASLYEYEAAAALVGKQATLTLSHQELALKGSVTFVSPVLAADSRTLTVRFEFPNPGLVLKPQMHVDVSLALDASTSVVVPDAALMDTGLRTIVFVETAPGTFEPRAVVVGVRGDGTAEILSGLREGELVAVKANFLLDSESRLRSAIERMTTGKGESK